VGWGVFSGVKYYFAYSYKMNERDFLKNTIQWVSLKIYQVAICTFPLNNFHMQLTAKLIQVLPLQTGTGKNGQWKKQDIIVETEGQFPKKVCITIWGDKINENQLQVGSQLAISFDVESREYNGKWYTDVKAWKIEAAGAAKATTNAIDGQEYFDEGQMENKEDLPF
jgi:C1A family cysteine protease